MEEDFWLMGQGLGLRFGSLAGLWGVKFNSSTGTISGGGPARPADIRNEGRQIEGKSFFGHWGSWATIKEVNRKVLNLHKTIIPWHWGSWTCGPLLTTN